MQEPTLILVSDKTNGNKRITYWLKVAAWIFGLAILLFVGLFFFTEWLQGKIERTVQKQSNGIYKLDLYGLEVSPFVGNISVDSLSLVPDYDRWQQLQEQDQKAPRMLLDLKSGKAELVGLNVLGILFGNSVDLDNLNLRQPTLIMTVMRQDTTEQHQPLYKTASGVTKELHIGNINVDSARLRYRAYHKPADYLFAIKQFNLTVADFKLDSQSLHSEERAYYAKLIKLAAAKASYVLPDSQYNLETDSLYINTEQQTLVARKIALTPLGSPGEMAQAKGRAVTFNEMKAASLRIDGINYHAHSLDNSLFARQAVLQQPTLNAFKDKKNYEDKGTKPLPHEMVQSVKVSFSLDSLQINNGKVRYEELAPKATERGHITFNNIDLTATNLTNIPEQISMENPAIVQASTLVMGKAPLDVTIRMPLLQKNGYHTMKGTIGEANPEILNPILVPSSFIRIESGHISRGEFEVTLNDNKANGSMTVIYSNLEIELLNKGDGGQQGIVKEVISEVADWVAIKDANPMHGNAPRVGDITVSRSQERSVFNYWKDCLASGFLSSMGLQSLSKK